MLFTATVERKVTSFFNSHLLLASLSSHYATNLKLCQSRTSVVRQTPAPRRRRRETCKTGTFPSLRAARWAALGAAAKVLLHGHPCLVFREACTRGDWEPSQMQRASRAMKLYCFPLLFFFPAFPLDH